MSGPVTSLHPTKLTYKLTNMGGLAQVGRLVAGFPQRWSGFEPRAGHVGFVVDEAALGQVFSE
jgi:hypothetical protein